MTRGDARRGGAAHASGVLTATAATLARRPGRVIVFAFAVLVCTAFLLSLRNTRPTYPSGDQALLEIYTRQALAGTLELGPYSRYGWHHPGPLFFYAIAPLYAAAGGSEVSLYGATFLVNLAALLCSVLVIGAHAGRSAALIVLSVMLIYLHRSGDLIASAWNPHAPILSLPLFIALGAAFVNGSRLALPAAAVVAAFLTQTHIGFAGVSLVLLAVSGAVGLRTGFRRGVYAPRSLAILVALTAVVAAAAWTLPLIEQAAADPGNLTLLHRFFLAARPPLPLASASHVFARAVSAMLHPASMDIHTRFLSGDVSSTPWLAAAQVAGVVIASQWSRRHRFLHAFTLLTLCALAAAFLSVRYIGEVVEDHQVYWMSMIGALALCAFAFGVKERCGAAFPARRPWTTRGSTVVLCALGAAVISLGGMSVRSQYLRALRTEAATRQLAVAVDDYLRRIEAATVTVRMTPRAWPHAAGLVIQLLRGGVHVSVEPGAVFMFGEPLRQTDRDDIELYVVDEAIAAQSDLTRYERVARFAHLFVFARHHRR
jgi:hypothetical protein